MAITIQVDGPALIRTGTGAADALESLGFTVNGVTITQQIYRADVYSDENGGGLKFGEPDIDLGADGEARRKIQPSTGRLVLFPSYMWHGTVPFESDEPRMTVSFDVVPK